MDRIILSGKPAAISSARAVGPVIPAIPGVGNIEHIIKHVEPVDTGKDENPSKTVGNEAKRSTFGVSTPRLAQIMLRAIGGAFTDLAAAIETREMK